jgi:hypothetical protein
MAGLMVLSAIVWAACVAAAPSEDVEIDGRPAVVDSSRRSQWEIVFADGISVKEYAQQLDYFKIEIGAVAKNGTTEYISQVSARKPDKRLGDSTRDSRWRIGWKKGTLDTADRALLSKAGVNAKDKQLLHFFPVEIQARLSQMERAYAKRDPQEIKRTRFEIRPKAKENGYEFFITEQDPPPAATEAPSSSRNRPASP